MEIFCFVIKKISQKLQENGLVLFLKKKNYILVGCSAHITFCEKQYFSSSNLYEENYSISGDYLFVLKLFDNQNIKIKFLNNYITIMRSGGDNLQN